MTIRPLAILALASALVASSSHAATLSYPDLASFNSALATAGLSGTNYSFIVDSFGAADPAGYTRGPATFAGQNVANGAAYTLNFNYGIFTAFYSHQLTTQVGPNTVLISFDAPLRAFAFNSNTWNQTVGPNPNGWPTSGLADLKLTTSAGAILNLSTPAYDGFPTAPIGFNGIISDAAFTSVTLEIPKGQQFQIINFTTAKVPEPSTAALLLLAAAGLLATGRRKTD